VSDNLPTLYRNIMDGLPSGFARDVFLWAVERPGEGSMCYRAEAFAREAEYLVNALMPMTAASFRILHDQKPEIFDGRDDVPEMASDLMGFVLTRHANWRFGGNVSPTYARKAAQPSLAILLAEMMGIPELANEGAWR